MGNSACPETFPTVGYLIPAMFQTTSLLFSLIENLNEVSKTTRTTSATGRVRFARKNKNQPLTHFKLGELEATGGRKTMSVANDICAEEGGARHTCMRVRHPGTSSYQVSSAQTLDVGQVMRGGERTGWSIHPGSSTP